MSISCGRLQPANAGAGGGSCTAAHVHVIDVIIGRRPTTHNKIIYITR
jgi:hypothetical protein